MSSGFDVDKLDYMLREAHLSGISLGISLQWLLKKVLLADLPADRVPDGLKSRIRNFPPDTRFAALSLARGGQFGFEEFCVARLTLHEKIYLHQKIRAAEANLAMQLAALPQSVPAFAEQHRWLYLRESMLEHPDLRLPTLPQAREPMEKLLFRDDHATIGTPAISELLTRRNLLFRAFCFGWQNAIAEPVIDGRTPDESGTDKLLKQLKQSPQDLLAKITARVKQVRELLKDEEGRPAGEPEIIVDPPRYSSIQQGHDTLYIEHPSRLALRWTMPIDRIVEYYHDNRALGYVFTTKPHLPYVLLAAERAVWDEFEVVYVQEGSLNRKVVKEASRLKARLHACGWYADARPLQPVSGYLDSIEAQTLVSKVARKLALFDSRTRRRVTPSSVTTFINQFPPELQRAALL
jgi:deoxynucleoside triphosphate triphosphohydrolase SAMHD1